jgi:4-coumarate--CoA ligase
MKVSPENLSADMLCRVVHDLIGAGLGNRMDSAAFLTNDGPKGEVPFGAEGYPVDSVDFLDLARKVTDMFHLAEIGNEDNLLRYRSLVGWADVVHKGWGRFGTRISFASSGSTGEPKTATHDVIGLREEVTHLAGVFAERKRIIGLVPCHHIYGFLFTVLLPSHMGLSHVEARHLGPGALRRLLREGDLIVAVPTLWRYLLSVLPDFPDDVHGVSSTAPCPPELLVSLREKGLTRMTEVYGSSETGGVGIRHEPGEPFKLLDFWQVERKDRVVLSRELPDGRRVVHDFPDLSDWLDERHFRILGRKDGAVQVAGHNVYPERVRNALLAHPAVDDCAVRLMRPEEGERLKAFATVLPEVQGGVDLERELHQWCVEKLRTVERPGHITFGPELPRNAMAKPADWPIS